MTPSGIEPATFRVVAQHLNHCATAVPKLDGVDGGNYRPKHVELIGIINKPLLLHLFGYYYYVIDLLFIYLFIYLHIYLLIYSLLSVCLFQDSKV